MRDYPIKGLMNNKQWTNNGNIIQDTKFEMCKELVNLVSDYVEKDGSLLCSGGKLSNTIAFINMESRICVE